MSLVQFNSVMSLCTVYVVLGFMALYKSAFKFNFWLYISLLIESRQHGTRRSCVRWKVVNSQRYCTLQDPPHWELTKYLMSWKKHAAARKRTRTFHSPQVLADILVTLSCWYMRLTFIVDEWMIIDGHSSSLHYGWCWSIFYLSCMCSLLENWEAHKPKLLWTFPQGISNHRAIYFVKKSGLFLFGAAVG